MSHHLQHFTPNTNLTQDHRSWSWKWKTTSAAEACARTRSLWYMDIDPKSFSSRTHSKVPIAPLWAGEKCRDCKQCAYICTCRDKTPPPHCVLALIFFNLFKMQRQPLNFWRANRVTQGEIWKFMLSWVFLSPSHQNRDSGFGEAVCSSERKIVIASRRGPPTIGKSIETQS